MAPLITIVVSLLGAGSIMALVNGAQTGNDTLLLTGITGSLAFLIFYIWILLPLSFDNKDGRYEATVFMKTMGHPRPLWASRFRFAWQARMEAIRVRLRLLSVAHHYSDDHNLHGLVWHVKSVRPR